MNIEVPKYEPRYSNVVTLGIYANGQYCYNIVNPEDLESHITYNLKMRPGRIFYVNGVRHNTGCIKKEYLDRYDKIASEFFEMAEAEEYKYKSATIPYR